LRYKENKKRGHGRPYAKLKEEEKEKQNGIKI